MNEDILEILMKKLQNEVPKEVKADPQRLADYLKGASDALVIWQLFFEDDLK